MASRPLKIAFTSLTLSLAVSLSLWVLHASYEQLQFSRAVTLQMPSVPAEINEHEVRESLRPDSSEGVLFPEPQMVELEQPPLLEGIETAPVSQQNSFPDVPPPFPSPGELEAVPELTFESTPEVSSGAGDTLQLPELSLSAPDGESPPVFPELDPLGTGTQATAPPLVELTIEPLSAPRPPAWLSVQATLEAEIKELQQQQEQLAASLAARERALIDWQQKEAAWKQEQQTLKFEQNFLKRESENLRDQLEDSRQNLAEMRTQFDQTRAELKGARRTIEDSQSRIENLQSHLEESQSETEELRGTLKSRSAEIGDLENEARKNRHQISELEAELQTARRSVRVPREPRPLTRVAELPDTHTSRPTLPLPDESAVTPEADVSRKEPLIPYVAGLPSPSDGTSPPAPPQAVQTRQPLIPAEVSVNETTRSAQCEQPPKKKGLIYDLKDWYHDWRHSNDSCTACEPICVRKQAECTETRERHAGEKGLISELAGWWKERLDDWD